VLTLVPDRSGYVPDRVLPSAAVRRELEEGVRNSVINPEDVSRLAAWGPDSS